MDLLDDRVAPVGLRGSIAASWTQCGATTGTCPVRYPLGVSPTICRKVGLNVPRLVKPTSKQMVVTVWSVSRSRNIERSIRRHCR